MIHVSQITRLLLAFWIILIHHTAWEIVMVSKCGVISWLPSPDSTRSIQHVTTCARYSWVQRIERQIKRWLYFKRVGHDNIRTISKYANNQICRKLSWNNSKYSLSLGYLAFPLFSPYEYLNISWKVFLSKTPNSILRQFTWQWQLPYPLTYAQHAFETSVALCLSPYQSSNWHKRADRWAVGERVECSAK